MTSVDKPHWYMPGSSGLYDAHDEIVATVNSEHPLAPANARLIAAAPETAAERDRLKAAHAEMLYQLRRIVAECNAAIEYEPLPKGYTHHDDVPALLRTVSHIKLSMIRGYAREAITNAEAI
jgi:hypothetical protein